MFIFRKIGKFIIRHETIVEFKIEIYSHKNYSSHTPLCGCAFLEYQSTISLYFSLYSTLYLTQTNKQTNIDRFYSNRLLSVDKQLQDK